MPQSHSTAFVSFEWNVTNRQWVPIFNTHPPKDREYWTIEVPIPAKLVNALPGAEVRDGKDV